jgi:hypothetical protein
LAWPTVMCPSWTSPASSHSSPPWCAGLEAPPVGTLLCWIALSLLVCANTSCKEKQGRDWHAVLLLLQEDTCGGGQPSLPFYLSSGSGAPTPVPIPVSPSGPETERSTMSRLSPSPPSPPLWAPCLSWLSQS